MSKLQTGNTSTGTLYNVLTHKPQPAMVMCHGSMCNETMYFDEAPSIWYCVSCKWCLEQVEGSPSMEED